MERPISHVEPAPLLSAHQFHRILLAACIIRAPLSLTRYVLAWPENPAPMVFNSTQAAPITTSALTGCRVRLCRLVGGARGRQRAGRVAGAGESVSGCCEAKSLPGGQVLEGCRPT